MNDGRTVYPSGYVAINDGCILSVGAQENCPYDTAAKVIDAQGKAILPGFVNTHTHVHDILLRGGLSDDRKLYDWLFNVIYTGLSAYGPEEIEAAGTLYCIEAIRSGITTFVDCHDFSADRVDMAVDGLISNYDRYGVRAVLARMFIDHMPTDMDAYIDAIISRGPEQRLPWDPIESTEEALASIEATIKR
ncbi:MAG: amidohydrolase family protein, partial [Pseudomonadales bacterium]